MYRWYIGSLAELHEGVDYVVELHRLLQHTTGNLMPFLEYVMSEEDRDDALIHIVIAKCEHLLVLHQSARPLS